MRNREWLYVTACCEEPVNWKSISAADAPVDMRHRHPKAEGFTVSFCPGCGELNPQVSGGCQPWEAVGLLNPELLERGLSDLAPFAARLATKAYLQAIANACAFNEDRGGYQSAEDEARVSFKFKIRMLVEE
jgi:hypothetical protein